MPSAAPSDTPPDTRADPPVEAVGNYVIERALARGSMGHVYVAHHALTHARVALKVLRVELASDALAEERFLREVRAAAHIGHEGIVRVHDAGRSPDGRLFLAMELLEGETLEHRLRRTAGERANAMQWLHAVLEPLAAAHAQGIVHRDLKPANVFIVTSGSDGAERVKLLDFGLARDTREKAATATGIALGTPYYMSPEQATEPRKVAAASDVWSLGVMMYEVACGAMPFDGETLHAVVIAASTAPHVPAKERAPGLDARLATLIDACLSKDPAARPQDASALRAQLGPLLDHAEVRAELARPIAVHVRKHHSGSQADDSRMPFAETAYSLPPLRLDASPARPQQPQPDDTARLSASEPAQHDEAGLRRLWSVALGMLALAAVSFAWLILRDPPPAASEADPQAARAAADVPDPAPSARPPSHDERGAGAAFGDEPLDRQLRALAADGGAKADEARAATTDLPPPSAADIPAPEPATPHAPSATATAAATATATTSDAAAPSGPTEPAP
jgi:eukaryotic-like serine/threonine-protein kinase